MKKRIQISMLWLIVSICFGSTRLLADTTTVTFNVNMNIAAIKGNFSPEDDIVDLAGTINNWGATPLNCSDLDEDLIYTLVVHGLTIGVDIEYKFRLNNSWGREELPGVGVGRHYVPIAGVNVVDVWYNNEIPEQPVAGFYTPSQLVPQGKTIQFIDQSLGYPTEWEWVFDGGTPAGSTDQNPMVNYTSPGIFSVSLIVSNSEGSDTLEKVNYIEITESNLSVDFNCNLSYQIQNGSFNATEDSVLITGNFLGWASDTLLTDEDGDGIYSISLSGFIDEQWLHYAYRINGNHEEDTSKYVVQSSNNSLDTWYNGEEPGYPYAGFYVSTTKPIPGELVRYYDYSDGGAATSRLWTFEGGDPATSTIANPTVTYTSPGTYTVSLQTTNTLGETTLTKQDYIEVSNIDNSLGWWNDAVFYQVYLRSYKDSDGDGIGDFEGMISKLDYLNDGDPETTSDLGVTALYIMPIHDCTNPHFGGYEVINYKSVTQQYGSPEDFDLLVTEAHSRGMKVILDMVFNHISYKSLYFESAKSGSGGKFDDYFVWNQSNAIGYTWRQNTASHTNPDFNYFWAHFGSDIPDLNFRNPSVQNMIKDVSEYWLNKNVDGFRLDAPMFLIENDNGTQDTHLPETFEYWREWNKRVKEINPNSFTVGETWVMGDIPTAAKYTYQGFDLGFEMNIAFGIEDALNKESNSYVKNPVTQSMSYFPYNRFGVLASNHDLYNRTTPNGYTAVRIKDRLTNNKDAKSKAAAAIVLTSPGVPFVYYGDEVGCSGGYARKPMQWDATANAGFSTGTPWEAVGTDYTTYNVATEQGDPNSLLNYYKKLIQLRLNEPTLRRGDYKAFSTSTAGVYAFIRQYEDTVICVLVNLTATQKDTVLLNVETSNILEGKYGATDVLGGNMAYNLVAGQDGKIVNWWPVQSLLPNATYVLKLSSTLGEDQPVIPNSVDKIIVDNAGINFVVQAVDNKTFITLSGIAPNQSVYLSIITIGGEEVMQASQTSNSEGELFTNFDTSILPSGIYLIRAMNSDFQQTKKISLHR